MSATRPRTHQIAFSLAVFTFVIGGAANSRAEDAKPTTVNVFDSAALEVPAEWKSVEPQSPRIVEHEFAVVDAEDSDTKARLTMMAAGGDVEANIGRWKTQITGGKADAQKTEKLEVADHTVHLVRLSGTYTERMGGGPFAPGPTVKRPDYAMLGAIIVDPNDRKFFVKLIGPEAVVNANREAFVKMIKGMKKQ